MSEDDQPPGDGEEQVGQDAIDDIFGGGEDGTQDAADGGSDAGMTLGDIEGTEIAHQSIDTNFAEGEAMAEDVSAIYDIPVQISAVLGRSTMQVSQLLKLGRGAVVELDRKVGEAIDIYVNNRLVARGEVVVVEDKLGVTMTEIVKSDRN